MQEEVEEEELPRTHLNTNTSCGNAKRLKQGTESLLLFFFAPLIYCTELMMKTANRGAGALPP